MTLPQMATITQSYETVFIPPEQVEDHTRNLVETSSAISKINAGDTVAVGVGSRGIGCQVEAVKGLIAALKKVGAKPFIFPAMGSHGGGTSQGQADVLAALGFSAETMGVEIRSHAEAILAGETDDGIPVYLDKNAYEADHLIPVNRIKLHTKFKGPVESGICKMLSVGIGKQSGATALHQSAVRFGFAQVIKTVALKTIEKTNFLFGLALIENAAKKIHHMELLTADTIDREEELLKLSAQIMPRIPFPDIDLLVVDEIGKEVSGTGMDTNVTGRNRDILGDFNTGQKVGRIFVRDLTAKTQGNANGIGLADFTTQRLVDKIDLKKTYTNALAAMSPEKAAIPMTMDNDREAVVTALESLGMSEFTNAKIVRIKNTSQLETMQISETLAHMLGTPGYEHIRITTPCGPIRFDADGNMADTL